MEDNQLVRKSSKGDTKAFEKLVLKYQNKMYYLCLKITKNEADAEDASQNAFIKAYKAIGSFKGQSAFSTWLYSIGRNSALDILKKRKDHENIDEQYDIADVKLDYNPEQNVVKKETAEILKKLIYGLPKDMREIIILREIKQMQYSEIAEILGISEGTVKSRISRAREKLREEIKKAGI